MSQDNITVYAFSGSPFVWRVLIYLEERGIKYEAKYLEGSKQENKAPEFLKLNPNGKLPTITFNGIPIYESMAIIEFFEKKYPGSKLTSEKDEILAEQLITIHDWLSNFVVSFRDFATPADQWDQKKLFELVEKVEHWFKKLDEKVQGGYLVGDSFSLADIVIFPTLALIWRLGYDFKAYKNLDKYIATMIERKSVKDSYPPHWIGTPNKTMLAEFFQKVQELRK